MWDLFSKVSDYLAKQRRRRLWQRLVLALACIVVFATVYALILPAITMEKTEFQPDGHIHTEECYRTVRTEEKKILDCPLKLHQHTEDCYDEENRLVCGYADFVVHTHDSFCYNEEGTLVCQLPEIRAHSHAEDQTETAIPVQETFKDDAEGFTDMDDSSQEAFEDDEGTAEENVPETDGNVGENTLSVENRCTLPEIALHTHDENCYDSEGRLVCGLMEIKEHQHTEECMRVVSEASEETILDCPYAGTESTEGEEVSDVESAPEETDEKTDEETDKETDEKADEEIDKETVLTLENAYTYEDEEVSVQVVLQDETELPEGAALAVRSILPEDDEYERLKELAEAVVGKEAARIGFYDISFYTSEGEYLPVEETATVTLRCRETQTAPKDSQTPGTGKTTDVAATTEENAEQEVPETPPEERGAQTAVLHYHNDDTMPVILTAQESVLEESSAVIFQTEGFSIFAVMRVAAGAGEPKATEDPLGLDGKNFAIVNCGGNILSDEGTTGWVLTSTVDMDHSNNLKGQNVAIEVDDSGRGYVQAQVTGWTFHRQTDGTYLISAQVDDEAKYLKLANGEGSLTLGDVTEATSVSVTKNENGKYSLKNSAYESYVNKNGAGEYFSCYSQNDNNSQHYLCDIVEPPEYMDYTGDWIVVNKQESGTLAMQAAAVGNDESKNRQCLPVMLREGNKEVFDSGSATVWHFERQPDGTHYISTKVIENGTEKDKYLHINEKRDAAVVLSDTPQAITVISGTGKYEGMVRLTNNVGMAVNRFGRDRGFGCYDDNGPNEWHFLCKPSDGEFGTVKTTNHPSTVLHLFDYWIGNKQYDSDAHTTNGNEWDSGINKNNTLKFHYRGQIPPGTEKINSLVGNFPSDIVANTLVNGYPALKDYGGESLDYLFDLEKNVPGKKVYSDVRDLLQKDRDGYYYYDSGRNFAEFDEAENGFRVYDIPGVVANNGTIGQFFPFNKLEAVCGVGAETNAVNHYLGMTMTTRFLQQYGGHVTSLKKKPTVFEFSGDDDVWIFIDDVLVGDVGGIHAEASIKIDFSTGNVFYQGSSTTNYTIKSAFDAAGKTGETEWNGNTFADNTYHTMKFFYLERGNSESNLYMKYNLTEIPLTAIYKVNQYGDSLAGAKFEVYPTDFTYEVAKGATPVYSGTTNRNGEMLFADSNGMPLTLTEIKSRFGEYFVLKEDPPEGYGLVSDDIHIHIINDVLMCENTYESGVWADSTLKAQAPSGFYLSNGDYEVYYDIGTPMNGTLFAVVLKYTPKTNGGLADGSNWTPVYGSDIVGYKMVSGQGSLTANVIETARKARDEIKDQVVFATADSGAMELEMKHLPGNVKNYYYMLDNDHKSETRYTVAYYWTAGSLDEATAGNTYRVESEDFNRAFGATIEVPNIINRFFVQKRNEDGELVNEARFALYKVVEEENQIYYLGKDNKDNSEARIYLENSTSKDPTQLSGIARVQGKDEEYIYEVEPEYGTITIKIKDEDGNPAYTISAYKRARTVPDGSTFLSLEGEELTNDSGEDGTAFFRGVEAGQYYLREIKVPDGYFLNPTEIMMRVLDNNIYANAGTKDDGVSVARGPGNLVATMRRFASDGDIDRTLSWIYGRLRVSEENHSFQAFENLEEPKRWNYLAADNNGYTGTADEAATVYLKYAPDDETTLFNYTANEGRMQTQSERRLSTDVGWSYYELYQDYEYGKNQVPATTTYTNLQGNQIQSLYSRSTYIRVTDPKVSGTLEISKKVVGEGGDAEYNFRVDLKDPRGNGLDGTYSYEKYEVQENGVRTLLPGKGGTIGKKDDGTDNWLISLKKNQIAVIEGIPGDTRYTVTEVQEETKTVSYIASAVRDDGKESVGTGTGEQIFKSNVVNGVLYWKVTKDADGNTVMDTTSTVDYTNTYPAELTIQKVDSTNYGINLPGAEFVLYREKPDNTKEYYKYGPEESDGKPTGIWAAAGDDSDLKDYTLTTGDKGGISLYDMDDGTYYLKELKAPDGYYRIVEEIEIIVSGGKLQENHYNNTGVSVSENGLILTVPNKAGYILPATGGHGTKWYTLCGAALMAISAIYMLHSAERRKRKKDMG